VASFAGALAVGTALLMLPISVVENPPADVLPAATGATGCMCVRPVSTAGSLLR
jgi:trk system potassium uptake protein